MSKQTFGFIGLGLIGGSIAQALRKARPEATIIAYNRSMSSLVDAMADGTINQAADTIGPAFSDCDIIFLCAPVSVNIRCLKELKPYIKPDCILTDVGSTKSTIHDAVEAIGLSHQFIGGHPMAGSEKSRYSAARPLLLENAYYVLTPGRGSSEAMFKTMEAIVKDCKALSIRLNHAEHDRIVAAISHLPHIIAFTLVNLVRESDNKEGMMRLLAAGGFKDLTRVASSSPEMWQQICTENKAPILGLMNDYIVRLNDIGSAISSDNKAGLLKSFSAAKDYRDDIPQTNMKSILGASHEIYVDLIDESGAIATIATILATNGISIMNIGIVHNREFQEGALHIEFYDRQSKEKASELLEKFHYTIHHRQ